MNNMNFKKFSFKRMKYFFSLALLFSILTITQRAVSSEIYIKLGEARAKKSLVAFPPLQYLGIPTGKTYNAVGSDLFNTITNDFNVASYFQFISQSAFIEDTLKTGLKPKPEPLGFDFKSWSAIGADFLIRGAFSLAGEEINLDIYVYHVAKQKLVFGKKYKGTVGSVRKLAHTFCNDALKELTGQEGMFTSKLVVSSDRAGGSFKEIFLMDWDGANPIQLTEFKTLSISPNWSYDGMKVAYTSYVQRRGKRNADLFLHDLTNGNRTLLSGRTGINSGASFSPDNKHIYLTISQGHSPDIFKLTLDGGSVSKITSGPSGAMNVEPAVSWDGNKIAFSSDRAGRPMIYVMNADGSGVKRLTFEGQFNSSPSWSPDGSKIAFAGMTGSNFDIFVMSSDGSNIIRLTKATKPNGKPANNEDPSFSPDGRFVMYTSDRSGNNQIYLSTVDGTEERQVTQDRHNYFKPKWSRNF